MQGDSHMFPLDNPYICYEYEPYLRVLEQECGTRDGDRFSMHWIEQSDGVPGVVIVATDGDRVVFERHYRIATGREHIELPRGHGIATDDDRLSDASISNAIRELAEETGIAASREECAYVGRIYTDPGIASTAVDVVVCRVGVEAIDTLSSESADEHEDIRAVFATNRDELDEMVKTGEIDDALTLSALLLTRDTLRNRCVETY